MEILDRYSQTLQKQILNQYRGLLRACRQEYDRQGMALVRKSYDFLVAHSGENQLLQDEHMVLYSTHLARMTVKELGMDSLALRPKSGLKAGDKTATGQSYSQSVGFLETVKKITEIRDQAVLPEAGSRNIYGTGAASLPDGPRLSPRYSLRRLRAGRDRRLCF